MSSLDVTNLKGTDYHTANSVFTSVQVSFLHSANSKAFYRVSSPRTSTTIQPRNTINTYAFAILGTMPPPPPPH